MSELLEISGIIIFAKLFLFWLWLWQLKEYHIGRFLAHFETDAFSKITSSLWRKKNPKFTVKVSVIFFSGIFFAAIAASYSYLFIWSLVILAPIVCSLWVLFLQIPTIILRSRILRKAMKKRNQFKNLLVIGITGSYGKTSTKEFLYEILFSKWGGKVLKTREHQNSEVGISQCILNNLNETHKIFIVEMGAYNRGGIKLLCNIAKPKWGILTGINEQHMSTFGSQENIIKGKYELIESLPEDGIAFFNGKNKYCVELCNKTNRVKKIYGQEAAFFGEENVLGAIAVARELGMTDDEIKSAVDKIGNKMPGVKTRQGIDGLKIIDATYSANPDGVIANLEYLNSFFGKKILVMPCLIELGKASKEVHRRIGKKIAEDCDLAIITTGDRFKEIEKNANGKAILIEDPNKILEKIKNFVVQGDTVLLESRVPKLVMNSLIVSD